MLHSWGPISWSQKLESMECQCPSRRSVRSRPRDRGNLGNTADSSPPLEHDPVLTYEGLPGFLEGDTCSAQRVPISFDPRILSWQMTCAEDGERWIPLQSSSKPRYLVSSDPVASSQNSGQMDFSGTGTISDNCCLEAFPPPLSHKKLNHRGKKMKFWPRMEVNSWS